MSLVVSHLLKLQRDDDYTEAFIQKESYQNIRAKRLQHLCGAQACTKRDELGREN